ncbi:MAG: hypothetical protein EZS28_036574, partial [Streblomastix strix]
IPTRRPAKNVQVQKLIVLIATTRHVNAATKSARNVQINFAKNVFLLAVNAKDAIRLFVLIVSSSNAIHAHHYCAPIIHSQKTNAIDAVSRYAIIVVISVINATITFVGTAIITIVNVPNATKISVKIAPRIAPSVKDRFAKNVQIKEQNVSHATGRLVRVALENVTNAANHSVISAFLMEYNVKSVITISVQTASYNVLHVKERCVMIVHIVLDAIRMFVKNVLNSAQHVKERCVMIVWQLESTVEHNVQDVTINGFVLIVASFSAKNAMQNGALITRMLVKHAANAKTRLVRAAIASVTFV